MRYFILAYILCSVQAGRAQSDLNLDFEREGPVKHLPGGWYFAGPGYSAELGDNDPASGDKCLTIRSGEVQDSAFAVIMNRLPVSSPTGRMIRLEGKVRAAPNAEYATAGYFARADDEKGAVVAFAHTYEQSVGEPGQWTTVSLELPIPEEAVSIAFGGVFRGKGALSFDALQLYIDGEAYVDPHEIERDLTVSPMRPRDPRLEWLRQYVHPLTSTDADFQPHADLEAFGEMVGASTVVGLGESTHGSHEIFTLKDRLFRYLNSRHDFGTFVLEGPLIASYNVNEYIERGEGTVPSHLREIGFWPWQTEEVVDLIEAMRQAPGDERPRFAGMDMQDYTPAYRILARRFSNDSSLISEMRAMQSKLDLIRFDRHEGSGYALPERYLKVVDRVIPQIDAAIREADLTRRDDRWLRQMVRLIEQFVDREQRLRDSYLAENVRWIQSVEDNPKVVVWAHNEHVTQVGNRMGRHLSEALGSDYVAVGFTFSDGQYTHSRSGVKETVDAELPYPATYEYWFDRLDEPLFYLDLREMEADNSPYADWFREELHFRKVGTLKPWSEFSPERLTEAYDIVFFVGRSSATRVLPVGVLYGVE
jgi:erythromycin esterase